MSQHVRAIFSTAMLWAIFATASPTIASAQQCQPGIDTAWPTYRANYDLLWAGLIPHVGNLTTLLDGLSNESPSINQSNYQTLLMTARSIAAAVGGRLVVTLADGTVVVDTSHPDGETPVNANSYAHFVAQSINQNQNSGIAIMAAQMFPCGVAIESKRSTTGDVESHFAVRLGPHLSSSGTARLSIIIPGPCYGCWDY